MDPINLLQSIEPSAHLKPLVLVYQGEEGPMYYGAIMDDINFVVWRASIPRSGKRQAFQDALTRLDDHLRR